MKKINMFAGLIGNALEWYDFLLYAFFASLLAPLFFPTKQYFFSLLLTFGVFAIGFFARPLGALVIGRVGDLYGRKKALIFSLSIMSMSTFCIGLLPTYQSIGILAPICLTLIRCLQGFAVAGEMGTSASFLIEHSGESKRGFAGSLVLATSYLGVLIGVLVVTLFTYFLPTEILTSWGWRIPFLIALPWGILGLFLRLRAMESPQFTATKEVNHKKTPIKTLFFKYPKCLLLTIGLVAINASCDYFFVTYFTTYISSPGSAVSLDGAMVINTLSIVVLLILIPLFGAWSDRVGIRKVFKISLIGMVVGIVPIFLLISQKTFYYCLLGEILYAFLLAGIDSVILSLLAELYPMEIRNTGITVSYNTSLMIFGGTTPCISIALVHLTNLSYAPALYGIVIGLIALVCLAFFKDPLHEDSKIAQLEGLELIPKRL